MTSHHHLPHLRCPLANNSCADQDKPDNNNREKETLFLILQYGTVRGLRDLYCGRFGGDQVVSYADGLDSPKRNIVFVQFHTRLIFDSVG